MTAVRQGVCGLRKLTSWERCSLAFDARSGTLRAESGSLGWVSLGLVSTQLGLAGGWASLENVQSGIVCR